jgi:hypothetical protein
MSVHIQNNNITSAQPNTKSSEKNKFSQLNAHLEQMVLYRLLLENKNEVRGGFHDSSPTNKRSIMKFQILTTMGMSMTLF